MSRELSTAIDSFLSYTDIQSHEYGIPSLEGIVFTDQTDIYERELLYKSLYDSLLEKVNKLLYLNEIKSLAITNPDDIEQEYQTIKVKLPVSDDNPHKIQQFLTIQNESIKTKSLLSNYLQITLPTIRSIHHLDFDFTDSEATISKNLSLLYSDLNKNLDANISSLMNQYNDTHDSMIEISQLRKDISELLTELTPKLNELIGHTQELSRLEQEYIDLLKNQAYNEKDIRNKFTRLSEKWNSISILLTIIPNFIMCLPLNWFDDDGCLAIIQQCGSISQEFDKYHRLMNKESMKNMNIDDLVNIGLQLDNVLDGVIDRTSTRI